VNFSQPNRKFKYQLITVVWLRGCWYEKIY
jgi:hypothetical protein